jgi:hypothetical protein
VSLTGADGNAQDGENIFAQSLFMEVSIHPEMMPMRNPWVRNSVKTSNIGR